MLACAPGVARAQALVSESWEENTTSRWVASSTVNAYDEAGPATTLNSSIDDGPSAPCAGIYAHETLGLSGGRVFTKPGVAIKPDTDYCLMAFVRPNRDGAPYVGLNFRPGAAFGAGSSTAGECWLIGQSGFNNSATPGSFCPPGVVSIGPNPENGGVPVGGTAWTWARRNFRTPATGLPGLFAYVKFEHFCGASDCVGTTPPLLGPDFDDLRLIEGVCPATPPADVAPHTTCAGNTPICALGSATTNAKCMDCTADFGAAGARPCPSAAAGLCVTAGPEKGACKPPCSGDFGTLGAAACGETTPFCRPPGDPRATCVPCSGDAGSAGAEACPTSNPTCFSTGTKAGACGKCTSNADCSAAKPRCDVPTGACSDTCATDPDCGAPESGRVCVSAKCADGCRGLPAAGNGCPAGKKCTSTGSEVGQCVDAPPAAKDSDGDGLSDDDEARLGTDPNNADTDRDLVSDFVEVGPDKNKPLDTDGDGIKDALDPDDDNDGIATRDEVTLARAANLSDDVDLDGKRNWLDDNADNDTLLDGADGAADQNNNGKPDFLDASWPAGGRPVGNQLPANLDPNPDGKFEGGGCVVAPGEGSRGAAGMVGIALGLAALGRLRRRRSGR